MAFLEWCLSCLHDLDMPVGVPPSADVGSVLLKHNSSDTQSSNPCIFAQVRRRLPPASRLAPLAGCSVRTLAAVELHVLGLLNWAPLAGWAPPLRGRKRPAEGPALRARA